MHNCVVHDPNSAHIPNGEANRETHRREAVIQNTCIILTWLGKLVVDQNKGTTAEYLTQMKVQTIIYIEIEHNKGTTSERALQNVIIIHRQKLVFPSRGYMIQVGSSLVRSVWR
jgi:hypothetical protein